MAWDSTRLRTLLELTKNVLHEMYVAPKEQEGRAAVAATMLAELKGDKKISSREMPETSPAKKPPGQRQT